MHIITAYGREAVHLHTLLTLYCCTLCSQTISWPLFEVLKFLFLHYISLANKWSRWHFHSLHILKSLFLWATGFLHNLPTQPSTKRDLGTIWMCVVSLTLHLHVPTEQEAGWARYLAWKPLRSEKSLDPARNLTSITHSSIQATHCQPHQLHYHSYSSTVSLILNVCHICKKNIFPAATSHLGKNESRNNLKMDYSKIETMTGLILTCTVQFCVI